MVVAQLVEWLFPSPEVCSSNPVIGKIYIEHLLTLNCIEKHKNKEKRGREWPFIKTLFNLNKYALFSLSCCIQHKPKIEIENQAYSCFSFPGCPENQTRSSKPWSSPPPWRRQRRSKWTTRPQPRRLSGTVILKERDSHDLLTVWPDWASFGYSL